MAKLPTETYHDYRDRVLDPLGPTFCGAKWYNATIWLGSGKTASCHHPPAHKIPLDEIAANPKALHNTSYKKAVRQDMLDGKRPPECSYCWKIEDLGPHQISDRVFKSVIYTDEELAAAKEMGALADVDLKTLEIAFDSTCNFACSYCNASFSTTWQNDIKLKGPYTGMGSDGRFAFQHNGAEDQPYGLKNEGNPYVAAFMKWWEGDLQHSLRELRITGGEATMSQDFWKLMDWWEQHPECGVKLAVNSNLGAPAHLIDRLADLSNKVKHFDIYTSCEAAGQQAEYIRDGLDYERWRYNLRTLQRRASLDNIHVMMTISALCLFSITDLMDDLLAQRAASDNIRLMAMSFNILRFPSFQSVSTLPRDIREERAAHLEQWLAKNYDGLPPRPGAAKLLRFEHDGLVRLIEYLREVDSGHDSASDLEVRQRDFKVFFQQYDTRRNKNFTSTFPELAEWYNGIKV